MRKRRKGLRRIFANFSGSALLKGFASSTGMTRRVWTKRRSTPASKPFFPNRRLTEPIRKLNSVRKSAAMRQVQKFLRLNICPGSLTSGGFRSAVHKPCCAVRKADSAFGSRIHAFGQSYIRRTEQDRRHTLSTPWICAKPRLNAVTRSAYCAATSLLSRRA